MASTKKKELHSAETKRQFEKHYRLVELTAEQAAQGFKTGCWLWQSKPDGDGYGQFRWNGELFRAHRFSYIYHIGEIDGGHDVDHKCNNRACVNPEHLQVVPHYVNMALQRERKGTDHNPGLSLLKREITLAERALAHALDFISENKVEQPSTYGVQSMEGAPWREYVGFEHWGDTKKDPALTRLALWLFVVSYGAPAYDSAEDILGVSQWTLGNWNANADWKADAEQARLEGNRRRRSSLKEQYEDTLEARAPFADFKAVSHAYEVLLKNEESRADRRARKNNEQKQLSGPVVIINLPPGTTAADLDVLAQAAADRRAALEGEYTEVVEPVPALPSGPQLDEDFEEAFADEEE